MALVAQGFTLTIGLIDSGENKTTRTFEMTATTAAAAETDAAAIVPQFAALTRCAITGYTIGSKFVEDALVLPAAGIQVENTAEILLNIEGSATKKAPINIPDPVVTGGNGNGMWLGATGPNSNVVDTAFAALTTFVANFGTLGDNNLLISDGEHANGISRGFRVHKKSRKG